MARIRFRYPIAQLLVSTLPKIWRICVRIILASLARRRLTRGALVGAASPGRCVRGADVAGVTGANALLAERGLDVSCGRSGDISYDTRDGGGVASGQFGSHSSLAEGAPVAGRAGRLGRNGAMARWPGAQIARESPGARPGRKRAVTSIAGIRGIDGNRNPRRAGIRNTPTTPYGVAAAELSRRDSITIQRNRRARVRANFAQRGRTGRSET